MEGNDGRQVASSEKSDMHVLDPYADSSEQIRTNNSAIQTLPNVSNRVLVSVVFGPIQPGLDQGLGLLLFSSRIVWELFLLLLESLWLMASL